MDVSTLAGEDTGIVIFLYPKVGPFSFFPGLSYNVDHSCRLCCPSSDHEDTLAIHLPSHIRGRRNLGAKKQKLTIRPIHPDVPPKLVDSEIISTKSKNSDTKFTDYPKISQPPKRR